MRPPGPVVVKARSRRATAGADYLLKTGQLIYSRHLGITSLSKIGPARIMEPRQTSQN